MTDARHIPKRVLHIHFGKEGGAERFFVSLCQSMARAGVEQRFLIRPGRSWAGQVRALGAVKEATYPRIAPIRALLQRWVDGQVRDWKPDAVIAWMPKAATLLPKAEGPAKLVRLGDYPRHIKHFARADCMIGNTPGVKARLEELNWPGPVEVISNFPRGGEADPDAVSFDLPKGSFVLSAAGRFVGLKGFDTLIRAMAQVEGTALCLIGDGEERGALEALARELKVSHRLQVTGWADRPLDWVAKSDAVCVTSTHEVLGNVVLEGWLCGVPVISTPAPGPTWLIEDGETGILLPDFTCDALVQGIRRLKGDPDLAARLVAGGSAKLQREFSEDRITEAYFKVIRDHRGTYP
jgi:glycosyltransferase involved in cell wall biosynthesis